MISSRAGRASRAGAVTGSNSSSRQARTRLSRRRRWAGARASRKARDCSSVRHTASAAGQDSRAGGFQ